MNTETNFHGRCQFEKSTFRIASRLGVLALAVVGIVSHSGCGLWRDSEVELPELPPVPILADTVVWEIRIVHIEPDDKEFLGKMWDELDEQHLSIEVQNQLEANGFRCGLTGMQYPSVLREYLDDQDNGNSRDDVLQPSIMKRRLQARSGTRFEIVSPDIHEQLAVLRHDQGQTTGTRYAHAQCILVIHSFADDHETARLQITPEIHHGRHRQRFTGNSTVLRIEAKRDVEIFDEVDIQTRLSAGQALVVTRTSPPRGLGGQFFSTQTTGKSWQKIVLLRLVQSRHADEIELLDES